MNDEILKYSNLIVRNVLLILVQSLKTFSPIGKGFYKYFFKIDLLKFRFFQQ